MMSYAVPCRSVRDSDVGVYRYMCWTMDIPVYVMFQQTVTLKWLIKDFLYPKYWYGDMWHIKQVVGIRGLGLVCPGSPVVVSKL